MAAFVFSQDKSQRWLRFRRQLAVQQQAAESTVGGGGSSNRNVGDERAAITGRTNYANGGGGGGGEADDIALIYFITPTYPRREQVAELTRLGQTLMHVPRLHWIVADDRPDCGQQTMDLLPDFGEIRFWLGVAFARTSVPPPPSGDTCCDTIRVKQFAVGGCYSFPPYVFFSNGARRKFAHYPFPLY